MTRKEILLFQIRECRNELLNAIAGLSQEQLAARPMEGRRPTGWIVCHCLWSADFFLHNNLAGAHLLGAGSAWPALAAYGKQYITPDEPAPDFSLLPEMIREVLNKCAGLVEELGEPALDRPGPHWHWPNNRFESVSGNCLRIVNHVNSHARQIWMLRGLMGVKSHYPEQTLCKDPSQTEDGFHVPDPAQG